MKQNLQAGWFYLVMHILLLLACIVYGILLTVRAHKNQVFYKTAKKMAETWQGFLKYANEATDKRIKEEERLQREQGNREKKNFFYRMDEILINTGLKAKMPFLTVELVLLLAAIGFLGLLILTTELFHSLLIAVVLCVTTAIGIKLVAELYLRHRQQKIENSILSFANLLENYSRTSDDIVSIFHKISVYLEEPLKSAVEKCYMEAYTTGDFSTACNHLDVSVGNRYFSDMLANIEICSRHRANYEEVIHGNKEIIRRYLAERDVQKEIIRQARLELGLMLLISGWTISILLEMLSEKTIQFLSGSMTGTIGTAIIAFVALHAVYTMISIGRERDA